MKNIKSFGDFLNESIQFDEIENVLNNCKIGTKIIIVKYKEDKERVVYYRGFRNGKHWVNYSPELKPYQNDFVLFPNRHVSIIEINRKSVESREDFEDRMETMMELDKERENKELEQTYKDAYHHSKKFPNVD